MKLLQKFCINKKISILFLNLLLLLGSNLSFSQIKEEWVKKHNGLAVDMVVDDFGNSILTGLTLGYGNVSEGIITSKYDKSGNLQWTKLFKNKPKSVDASEDIAVDKLGNIYIAGWTDDTLNGETNQVFLTIKYNSSGNQEWVQLFDTIGSEYDVDVAHSIAVDHAGNVYVTGESLGAITIKYSSQGEKLWVKSFKPTEGVIYAEKNELDNEGNVYVFGSLIGFNFYNYILIKYDPWGNELWNKVSSGYGCILCLHKPMVVDNKSNAYVIGPSGTVKYDPNGNLKWKVSSSGAISVDSSGNTFIAYTKGDQQQSSIIVEKFNNEGLKLWDRKYVGPVNMDQAYDIVNDRQGNTYVTGMGKSTLSNSDIITLKFDSDGQLKWEVRYDESDFDYPKNIRVDLQQNVFVLGSMIDQDKNYTQVLIKYSQQNLSYGLCCFDNGLGPQAVCGTDVTPLNCYRSGNNAFFAGYVDNCESVDTIAICNKTPSAIQIQAKYKEKENSIRLTWNKESSGKTPGFYIQRSKDGNKFKTIGFVDVNAIGQYQFNDPYPEIENYYKIVWFEPRGFESNKVLAVALTKNKIQVFPNPATNKVRIVLKEFESNNANLIVTDDMGRVKISRKVFKGTTPELEVSNYPSGIYIISIEINGKILRQRFVKR